MDFRSRLQIRHISNRITWGFAATAKHKYKIRKSALNYAQISHFNLREKYFLVKLFTFRLAHSLLSSDGKLFLATTICIN